MRDDLWRIPIVVAPMGGGPSTPELIIAAAEAGALGFLAAGYKTAEAMQGEIEAVRKGTDRPFGVNVFVPQLPGSEPEVVAAYVASLEPEASRLGVACGEPDWDDDHWNAKIEGLLGEVGLGAPERDVPRRAHHCQHARFLCQNIE